MANNDFNLKVGVEAKVDKKKIQDVINMHSKDIKARVALDLTLNKEKLQSEANKLREEIFKKYDINIDNKTAIKAIKDTEKEYAKLLKARRDAYQSIGTKSPELSSLDKYYTNLEKSSEKVANQNKKLADSMDIVKTRSEGANRGFSAYLKTLKPQALKEYSTEINKISNAFSESSRTGDKSIYSKANASLSNFKSTMKDAGMETASFTTILKQNIGAFSQWLIIGNVVSGVMRNFRDAIGTIKEVDTLLTEISKTSNLSGNELKQLGINAFDAASKYGNTVQSYLEGYKEMSRGTDQATAQGLTEMSILAQSAGDMTAELANEYIIATNAAYKLNGEVSKINAVLDSQNQISNRNQVSMSKLAEATKVAGSQSATSGVQINEMTAAISTMAVVTQGQGEQIGRAWKGILMNLQQVKGETEDGEIIDSESLGKAEKAALDLGVRFKEMRNGILSLRDPMQVIKELSKAYTSLAEGDVRGTNLISAIGGKYRGNEFAALLSNYEMYTKILGDYENANGSALEEAQKTADSIEGRLNKLTNTWNKAVANVVESDMLKTFIGIGTGAIELADDINLLQNALIALGGVATYKFFTGFIPMVKNAASSTLAFGNALNVVNAKGFVADTTNLSGAIQGLTVSQATAVLSTQKLTSTQIIAAMTTAGFSDETASATASTLTMATAQKVATTSTLGLGTSLKALGAAIKANPIGLIITGITLAVSALSFGINKYKQEQEEAIATAKENAEKAKTLTKEISDLTMKYYELSEAVKTDKSVKDSLLTTQNELLTKLGLEGKSIDELIAKYGDLTTAIREVSLEKLKESELDLIGNKENAVKDLEDAFDFKFVEKYSKETKKSADILREAGLAVKQTLDSGRGGGNKPSFYFGGVYEDNLDGIRKYYADLEKARQALRNSGEFTDEELVNDKVYKLLTEEINNIKPSVENANSAISSLNDNLSQQQMLIALQGKELPKTQEEFDLFKQQLIDSAMASGKFVGSSDDIKASIDTMLMKQPQFNSFFDGIINGSNGAAISAQATAKAIKDITTETNTLISATSTLANALKEQKDNGELSAKSIMSIIDAGYANVLVEENGQLKISAELYKIVANRKIDLNLADLELLKVDLTKKFNKENVALHSMALTTLEANKAALEYHKTQAMMSDSGVDLAGVDAQIVALNSMKDRLAKNDFWNETSKKKSSDPWKDDFDKKYNALKHQLTLDKITQEEYFNSLTTLNKKYFVGRAKYIDEDRKNLEELYSIQKSLNSKLVSDMEHNLQMGINKDISEEAQIASLKAIQDQVHQQAQYWRSQGLDENHEYIQELQNQWWKYHNQITDIREKAVKKAQDAVKDAFEEREKLIEEQKKNELDALEETRKATIKNLNDQIDKYRDIVNAKKESLRADKDANDYQEKLKGHTDDISKIESEITTLTKAANSGDREAMAQKRKLEEDLNKAKGDLAKTQKDHEYDLATDALDKELTAYEKMKKSEIDSMESYYDYEKVKIENNYSEKLSLAQSMHDKEMQMIEQSATLMKTSYGSALDELSRIIDNANLSIANSIELQSQSLLKSANITIDADKLDQLQKSMSTIKLPSIAGSLGSSISNISNISNKSSVISPVINLQLGSGTTIDKNAINEWNKFRKDITNDVSKALMDVINKR